MTTFITYLLSIVFAIFPAQDTHHKHNHKVNHHHHEKTEIADYDINP